MPQILTAVGSLGSICINLRKDAGIRGDADIGTLRRIDAFFHRHNHRLFLYRLDHRFIQRFACFIGLRFLGDCVLPFGVIRIGSVIHRGFRFLGKGGFILRLLRLCFHSGLFCRRRRIAAVHGKQGHLSDVCHTGACGQVIDLPNVLIQQVVVIQPAGCNITGYHGAIFVQKPYLHSILLGIAGGQDKENVSGRRVDQGVRFQGSGAEDLGLSIRRRIDVAVILNRCLQRCAVICRLQLGSRFSFRSLGGHLGI